MKGVTDRYRRYRRYLPGLGATTTSVVDGFRFVLFGCILKGFRLLSLGCHVSKRPLRYVTLRIDRFDVIDPQLFFKLRVSYIPGRKYRDRLVFMLISKRSSYLRAHWVGPGSTGRLYAMNGQPVYAKTDTGRARCFDVRDECIR